MTWEASRPLVLVLIVASFARSLIILAEPYFYTIGRPALWFWMTVCRVGDPDCAAEPCVRPGRCRGGGCRRRVRDGPDRCARDELALRVADAGLDPASGGRSG
jgi:hypothetical protein